MYRVGTSEEAPVHYRYWEDWVCIHISRQEYMSNKQEEADIKEMIDEEYERKEQENLDYYKQIEEE